MAKEKEDMKKQQSLEQENRILREKLAEQEKLHAETNKILGGELSQEMKKIRQKGKSTANSIVVKEFSDHRNVSLWTKDGKRIGPLHPENAVQTLNRFADIGIFLTSDRPTQEQIDAYMQTTEYKLRVKKEKERRETKNRSRRSGQLERLSAEIAKMAGTNVEAINHILKAHEVRPLSSVNKE